MPVFVCGCFHAAPQPQSTQAAIIRERENERERNNAD